MAKHYIESLESQFIVEAATPAEAVAKFIGNRIKQSRVEDIFRMTFWTHEGCQVAKRATSVFDAALHLSEGQWKYLCFLWFERRGMSFMKKFAELSSREVVLTEFE
jgi:hypothetical protein